MIKNQKGQVLSLAFLLSTETLVNYLHLLGLGKLFICSYMNITVCVCDREREEGESVRGREGERTGWGTDQEIIILLLMLGVRSPCASWN